MSKPSATGPWNDDALIEPVTEEVVEATSFRRWSTSGLYAVRSNKEPQVVLLVDRLDATSALFTARPAVEVAARLHWIRGTPVQVIVANSSLDDIVYLMEVFRRFCPDRAPGAVRIAQLGQGAWAHRIQEGDIVLATSDGSLAAAQHLWDRCLVIEVRFVTTDIVPTNSFDQRDGLRGPRDDESSVALRLRRLNESSGETEPFADSVLRERQMPITPIERRPALDSSSKGRASSTVGVICLHSEGAEHMRRQLLEDVAINSTWLTTAQADAEVIAFGRGATALSKALRYFRSTNLAYSAKGWLHLLTSADTAIVAGQGLAEHVLIADLLRYGIDVYWLERGLHGVDCIQARAGTSGKQSQRLDEGPAGLRLLTDDEILKLLG